MTTTHEDLIARTTTIVAATVSNPNVVNIDMPVFINAVYDTLAALGTPKVLPPEVREPAVPVKESVFRDRLVCLECGKGFQSLKRHIGTAHDQSPAEYRAEWGLPKDYPLVTKDYAAKRSQLAKANGLGRKPAGAVR